MTHMNKDRCLHHTTINEEVGPRPTRCEYYKILENAIPAKLTSPKNA